MFFGVQLDGLIIELVCKLIKLYHFKGRRINSAYSGKLKSLSLSVKLFAIGLHYITINLPSLDFSLLHFTLIYHKKHFFVNKRLGRHVQNLAMYCF